MRYSGVANRHTYLGTRRRTDYGGAICQSLAGPPLDQYVRTQVLAALEPAALELSLEAATQLERERDDLNQLWQQRLERAAYEAERAGRQYRLAEPENRLVVRQLEREWEERLAAQQQLDEEYHRFLRDQPRLLSETERAAIRHLASDIPALWDAPTTTEAERKEIIRQVVGRVVVDAQGSTEQVSVRIAWVGGSQTEGVLIRPVARLEQLSYDPQLCDRLRTLVSEGLGAEAIADRLNAEGYRPPKRRARFGRQGVLDLLQRLGVREAQARSSQPQALGVDEWWLPALAQHIGMPAVTLYNWIQRGWVQARQQEPPDRHWIVRADAAEVARLPALHQRPAGYYTRRLWIEDGEQRMDADTAAHLEGGVT